MVVKWISRHLRENRYRFVSTISWSHRHIEESLVTDCRTRRTPPKEGILSSVSTLNFPKLWPNQRNRYYGICCHKIHKEMKTTESFVSTKLVIFKQKSDGFVKKKKFFSWILIFFKRFGKMIVFVKQKLTASIINPFKK